MRKTYPISDQNGSNTIPFGAAHTYIAYISSLVPRRLSYFQGNGRAKEGGKAKVPSRSSNRKKQMRRCLRRRLLYKGVPLGSRDNERRKLREKIPRRLSLLPSQTLAAHFRGFAAYEFLHGATTRPPATQARLARSRSPTR